MVLYVQERPAVRRPRGLPAPTSGLADRHGLGLLMAASTAALMTWGLGRPALWLDEAATMVATQRTWPHLWLLRHGPEAPLLPYYALLKLTDGGLARIAPGFASHPELLLRWPSALASVLAGWALVEWLTRRGPIRLAVGAGAVLLLIGGFSRYGQEARPYAGVLLMAVLSTVAWSLAIDRRRRWPALYAGCTAMLIILNSLAVGLVLAHVVASVVAVAPGRRRVSLVRTLAAAIPALLLAAPFAVASVGHGLGPTYYPTLTVGHAYAVFVRVFSYSSHPFLGVGPVILLAAIGLSRVNSVQYGFVARVAACWALIPPVVLVLADVVRENLLFGRYMLYAVPGWAILGGLGLVTVMDLAALGLARVPRLAAAWAPVLAGAVAVAVLAGTAVGQSWTLSVIRTAGGHGEDLRPALAMADRPQYASLPIVVSSQLGAVEVMAYDQPDSARLAGLRAQRSKLIIWPVLDSYAARTRFLSGRTRVILFERGRGDVPHCTQTLPSTPAAQIDRCMPALLQRLGYRVAWTEPSGLDWSFSVLERRRNP